MRHVVRIAFALVLSLFALQVATAHSVEELLRAPAIRDIDLSPDGKKIAIAFADESEAGDAITVVDADRLDEAFKKQRVHMRDIAHVLQVAWVNDERLLVAVDLIRPKGTRIKRTFTADADLRNWVVMFSGTEWALTEQPNLARIVAPTSPDGRHVFISPRRDLFSVDAYTGQALRIADGGRTGEGYWAVDETRAALRYNSIEPGTDVFLYGRSSSETRWVELARYGNPLPRSELDFAADAPGEDKIYVRTRKGSDTFSVSEFDLGTMSVGKVIAEAPGHDIDSALVVDGAYLGARYAKDRVAYVLVDSKLQQALADLGVHFGDQANIEVIDVDRAHERLVVRVEGPQVPGAYYLCDLGRATPQLIVSTRPWLNAAQLAPVEVRKTQTRDGRVIESYLTRPAGTGARPLIVMPHDGPAMRDRVEFNGVAQAFAANGWLVLQTNFRGSFGYGKAFEEAGNREWGGRMQDDLTDAAQELVKEGIVDPQRIAIYGEGYGGYAALAGAAFTSGLYRAAVAVNGIFDLPDYLDQRSDTAGSKSATYRYWVDVIGDPSSSMGRDMLVKRSPRQQAAQVHVPVLLVSVAGGEWGAAGRARGMSRELKAEHKDVTLAEFQENLPWWSNANEVREVQTAIEFISRKLVTQ